MAGIETYLEQIKNAIYGREVRQAIHDGIETCYNEGKAGATDLIARERITEVNDSLSARIDEIIAPSGEAPSAAEVTDARIGADGVTYASLGTANRTQFTDLKSDLNVNRTLIGTFVSRNLIHYLRPFHWLDNKQRNTTGAVVDRTGWATSVETIPVTPNVRYYTNADVFVYYDADGNYVSTQDRASGSNSIKVPNNSAIVYAYINWKSIVDANTKYIIKEESGYTGTWLIEHAQDYEIVPNENITDSTDENLQFRNLPVIQFGEGALFSKRLTAMLTGEKIIQDLLRDRYGRKSDCHHGIFSDKLYAGGSGVREVSRGQPGNSEQPVL